MKSLSRAHWVAQNHLGRLTVRADDPAQLVIASTIPFPRHEATAWWVAFDLVETFDKKLRRGNHVLGASSGRLHSTFAGKKVAGAGHVEELVKYVETLGWEPTNSTVHVSDVSVLVTKLGGEQLSGKDADRLNVALRELIQNAADAICVRRSLASGGFVGCIFVRLRRPLRDRPRGRRWFRGRRGRKRLGSRWRESPHQFASGPQLLGQGRADQEPDPGAQVDVALGLEPVQRSEKMLRRQLCRRSGSGLGRLYWEQHRGDGVAEAARLGDNSDWRSCGLSAP